MNSSILRQQKRLKKLEDDKKDFDMMKERVTDVEKTFEKFKAHVANFDSMKGNLGKLLKK